MPSFDSSDAVEWTCMSARVFSFMTVGLPCKLERFVKKALSSCDLLVNGRMGFAADGERLPGAHERVHGSRAGCARARRAARRNRAATVRDNGPAGGAAAVARSWRVGCGRDRKRPF